jgi:hypothetical protein
MLTSDITTDLKWPNFLWLSVYAVAMALVEAALVIHLRTIYYPEDPLSIFPIVLTTDRDLILELAREFATILMILSVSLLHSRRAVQAFGAFIYVFGIWDIAYYAWLKVVLGWPTQWLEWDVLFLIPWPWLGPWIAPVLASILFIAAGALLLFSSARFTAASVWSIFLGSAVAIASFLWPAWPLVAAGTVSIEPGGFSWPLFIAGYLLMALGLGLLCRQRREFI